MKSKNELRKRLPSPLNPLRFTQPCSQNNETAPKTASAGALRSPKPDRGRDCMPGSQ